MVGGNGSGKTTFLKILTGLYAPEGGGIELDGQAIDVDKREAYRQMFAGIFADVVVFQALYGIAAPELNAQTATTWNSCTSIAK